MTFRVRAQDANSDYSWGQGALDFLVDSPAAVAQVVETRLLLFQGEWAFDLRNGTPWMQSILGKSSPAQRNQAIRARILSTPFVLSLENFSATVNVANRSLSVSGFINTAFGGPIPFGPVPFSLTPQGPFQLGFSPLGGSQGAG